jgi:hypothetical protein
MEQPGQWISGETIVEKLANSARQVRRRRCAWSAGSALLRRRRHLPARYDDGAAVESTNYWIEREVADADARWERQKSVVPMSASWPSTRGVWSRSHLAE